MRKYGFSILLVILSFAFVLGEQTFAGPCPVMPNGKFMVCHCAGQAVFGVGSVLIFLSFMHLLFKDDGIRRGLDLALAANSVLLIFIPGHLINLCMKNTMRCHTIMEPFVLVMGVLIIAVAVVDFYFRYRRVKKEGTDEI